MQQGEDNMSLGDYLVWLGKSADNLKDHLKNPRKTMRGQGVSAEDQALLLGGDPDEVVAAAQELEGRVAIIVCGNWPIIVSG
jgi:hypothetical protein